MNQVSHSTVAKFNNIYLNHVLNLKMKNIQPFIQVSHFDFKKYKQSQAKTTTLVSLQLYKGKCILNLKRKKRRV